MVGDEVGDVKRGFCGCEFDVMQQIVDVVLKVVGSSMIGFVFQEDCFSSGKERLGRILWRCSVKE